MTKDDTNGTGTRGSGVETRAREARDTTDRMASALRDHWNGTRAHRPQPGDSTLGVLIGALLEALANERKGGV